MKKLSQKHVDAVNRCIYIVRRSSESIENIKFKKCVLEDVEILEDVVKILKHQLLNVPLFVGDHGNPSSDS